MAKKKNKGSTGQETGSSSGSGSTDPTARSRDAAQQQQQPPAADSSTSSPALVICRNKHWRYISSFHGPWLQLPIEVLETLANANYYMPLPRPVDPAVFYDLVKIRQLVDGATDLAVRAANGITSSALSNSLGGGAGHQMQALGLGFGDSGGTKLSPERRFRMREQATQKLARAYRLDEIASSVATMQSTSTLENVAGLVLQRANSDVDANYVHFFHEKIPSRQLAECTNLDPLNQIIAQRPADCEPLRTRAIVRTFKDDFEGAVRDLTSALATHRIHRPSHRPVDADAMSLERRPYRRRDAPPLDEKDQPSSTESQLLFQRAGCYLTMACGHIEAALPAPPQTRTKKGSTSDAAHKAARPPSPPDSADGERPSTEPGTPMEAPGPTEAQLGHRKLVRQYAKRGLRDYMEYLKQFHYSPNFPIETTDDFTRQVNQATNRTKKYYSQNRWNSQDGASPSGTTNGHTVYNLADLFAASPPADLPAYPSTDLVTASSASAGLSPSLQNVTTEEVVTYHPLLTDALHSLLLCHTLIQTSAKELQRHAYMVARLARLADGFPVFQASRSPARADWIEVLRRANNWIELATSWETLCAPAPLPMPHHVMNSSGVTDMQSATAALNKLAITADSPSPRQRAAITENLEDQYSHDAADDASSFKSSTVLPRAPPQMSSNSSSHSSSPRLPPAATISPPPPSYYSGSNSGGSAYSHAVPQQHPPPESPALPKRWAVQDGREYPILTERADGLARWVKEAPAGSGVVSSGKRKKKVGTGGGGSSGKKGSGVAAPTLDPSRSNSSITTTVTAEEQQEDQPSTQGGS